MPRYRLTVEYDGTGFVGWQRQTNGRSIQQALEEAVFAFAGVAARVHGAGRTDAGVHALAQSCHLDLPKPFATDTIRDALNAHLKPARIAVLRAAPVRDDFDARRDATHRIYRYRIVNRRSPLTLERERAWHVMQPLDLAAMRAGAATLVGTHDFTSFRSVQCQAPSPVRTLDHLSVEREGDVIQLEAHARSFLHNQMRAMVGSLVHVGDGHWDAGDLATVLAARDRQRAGPNAPPWGLYLVEVGYPADA